MDALKPLHLLASLFAATFTGMGVGSGGLFLLWLTLGLGIPQKEAQGMNLLFSIGALLASALYNAWKKRIPGKVFGLCLLAGLPGCTLGSFLSHRISPFWLRRFLGIFLILGGFSVIYKTIRDFREKKQKKPGKIPPDD